MAVRSHMSGSPVDTAAISKLGIHDSCNGYANRHRDGAGLSIVSWILATYLVASPLISILGVSGLLLTGAKAAAFSIVIVYAIARGRGVRRFRFRLLILVALAAVALLSQLPLDGGLGWWRGMIEIGAPALILASVDGNSALLQRSYQRGGILAAALSLVVASVASASLSVAGWLPGVVEVGPFLVHRVSWAATLAFVGMGFVVSSDGRLPISVRSGCLAAIVLGQFAAGGRSGLAALAIGLTVLALSRRYRTTVLTTALVCVAGVMAFVQISNVDVLSHLRVEDSPGSTFDQLNRVSSFRLELLVESLPTIDDAPILGGGLGYGRIGNLAVHVNWLRIYFEFGVIILILSLILVGTGISRFRRNELRVTGGSVAAWSIAAMVIVISALEPAFPIGSVHQGAALWFLLGLPSAGGRRRRTTMVRVLNPRRYDFRNVTSLNGQNSRDQSPSFGRPTVELRKGASTKPPRKRPQRGMGSERR